MRRDTYKIFSEAVIGRLTVPNRLVRSATYDPSLLLERRMSDEVLALYGQLAAGGAGLIITGDIPVVPQDCMGEPDSEAIASSYEKVRIEGFGGLVDSVRQAAPECRIIAQISAEYNRMAPSAIPSPFSGKVSRALTTDQVKVIVDCAANTIVGLEKEGFDGVQMHAAHGGLWSRFLSPYSNRREDDYGGSVENRARIIGEIVSKAREKVGDFPILIKMNSTDYVPGGIDADSFPDLAKAIERCGVDAIEISGGMRDCLVMTEDELGFRPVPAPESHTRIKSPEKQSYFLAAAERLALGIPVILAGGNRDIERLEEIIQRGKVDFISLCRPLIREPDLPNRWLEGRGSSGTACISCNSCIYDMWNRVGRGEPWVATCPVENDRARVREAQQWLTSWGKRQHEAFQAAPHPGRRSPERLRIERRSINDSRHQPTMSAGCCWRTPGRVL